ncbi:hypothetical protein IWQ62_000530 [Dispira parvispora]|uniref:Extracellular metalloproteinase n=1 Tax=Dispira parvispora TaxID=1520584 RepID=A0A9W8AY64_9FUNG|nr:hypothetical protein IWQ62_000530 [Dispira parvispora]
MKFITKNLGLILVAYSALWASALSSNGQRPRLGLVPHLNLAVSETLPDFAVKSNASTDPVAVAQEFTSSYFGLAPEDYRVLSSYKTDRPELYHVHLRQHIDGLDVANGDMNININATGGIVSYGSSFLLTPKKGGNVLCPAGGNKTAGDCALPVHRRQDIKISPKQALVNLAEYMKTPLKNPESIVEMTQRSLKGNSSQLLLKGVDISIGGDVPVRPTLVITENNKLVHAHEMEIRTTNDWAQGYVDSQTGNVVMYSSYAKDAYYRVQPLGTNDPGSDSRRIVKDTELKPEDVKNWHYNKTGTMYRETRGNNVHAQADPQSIGLEKWEQLPRPQANADMGFDFPIDLSQEPGNYSDAAVTNLFYWCNIMHDILYQYGFNEVAGNLQDDNFNRGGKGNDAVAALAQYGYEMNNALMMVGPDGERPIMMMFLWDYTTPMRDGDLASDVIIHEYTHALSTRLTGGPNNGACLRYGESDGMGEGWSDFVAVVLTTKKNRTAEDNVTIGEYVIKGGMREYPYSLDQTVNPLTYESINEVNVYDVHALGTIWATILFEVYWAFVGKYGYTADFYSASETHGNTLVLKLVVLGMKLQPCQPTFKDARDAIILADRLLTGSKNLCLLWGAFAKRGLGVDANATETGYKNGFGDSDTPGEVERKANVAIRPEKRIAKKK